jgi:glycosyltransferase involved in cell wall biosynthesis
MDEMLPRVSVIIITYNHARLLPIAIDSVLTQTYPAIELIVVDDGSTDDTPTVMQQYAGRVNYIRQENRGVVAARNVGICAATGEFINFLDSDDFFLPAKIDRQMRVFKARPDVGLVHCGFYQVNEAGHRLNKVTWFPSDHILRELAIDCFLLVHAPLVRREWFDRVGLFNELPWERQYCEDWDLWLRMAKAGCQFAYVREPLIAYRILEGSQMTDAAKMERGSIGVLDRFFAAPDLPADVMAAKSQAYGLRRLWIGFSYYESGKWEDAQRNIAEAFATYPAWTEHPGLVVQKIVDAALIPRVEAPLAFVGSVLAHLPPEASALQRYGPYLRGRVMTSLAVQSYAAGDIAQAHQQLAEAIDADRSLLESPDEFRAILCHYAMSLPVSDPVAFADGVLGNLPAAAERLKGIRPRVLADVNLACAFADYEQGLWTRTIQHVMNTVRYRPAGFRNRGLLSILVRSMIKLFKDGREASPSSTAI